MPRKDPRVDAYVAAAAPFAQPVLRRVRGLVHRACPSVEEALRWGHPAFLLGGRILCIVSAFQAHCGLVFWNPAMKGHLRSVGRLRAGAMGHYGRIASAADLPADAALLEDLRKAVELGSVRAGSTPPQTRKSGVAGRAGVPEKPKAPGRRPKASKGAPSED